VKEPLRGPAASASGSAHLAPHDACDGGIPCMPHVVGVHSTQGGSQLGGFLVWLLLCAAVIAGLTAVAVVLVVRRIGRDVAGRGRTADFVVVDCGDQSISCRSAGSPCDPEAALGRAIRGRRGTAEDPAVEWFMSITRFWLGTPPSTVEQPPSRRRAPDSDYAQRSRAASSMVLQLVSRHCRTRHHDHHLEQGASLNALTRANTVQGGPERHCHLRGAGLRPHRDPGCSGPRLPRWPPWPVSPQSS